MSALPEKILTDIFETLFWHYDEYAFDSKEWKGVLSDLTASGFIDGHYPPRTEEERELYVCRFLAKTHRAQFTLCVTRCTPWTPVGIDDTP